jgi:hypothetical protein
MAVGKVLVQHAPLDNTKISAVKLPAKNVTLIHIWTNPANLPKPIAPPAATTVPRAPPPATPTPPPASANEPTTTKTNTTTVNRAHLAQIVRATMVLSLKNFRRCRVIGAPQQQVQSFHRAAKATAVSMPTPWPSKGVAHSAQQPTLPSAPPLIYPTPRPTRNA